MVSGDPCWNMRNYSNISTIIDASKKPDAVTRHFSLWAVVTPLPSYSSSTPFSAPHASVPLLLPMPLPPPPTGCACCHIQGYVGDPWNVFDALVVIGSVVDIILSQVERHRVCTTLTFPRPALSPLLLHTFISFLPVQLLCFCFAFFWLFFFAFSIIGQDDSFNNNVRVKKTPFNVSKQ